MRSTMRPWWFAIAIGGLTAPATAATLVVCPDPALDPTCDWDSIQAAIDAAGPADDVRVTAGSYSEVVRITGPVVVAGDDPATVTLRSGVWFEPVLEIDGATGVTLSGMTIVGWDAGVGTASRCVDIGGASAIALSDLVLEDCTGEPGAGFRIVGSDVDLVGVTVSGAQAVGAGGALDASAGSVVTWTDGTATGNHGWRAGAVHVTDATFTATNTVFSDNVADGLVNAYGGAVLAEGASVVTLDGCSFAGNSAGAGGHLAGLEGTASTVIGGTFDLGFGWLGAAGIYVRGASLVIDGGAFTGNETPFDGGAIGGEYEADVRILGGATFAGNSAALGAGGAVGVRYGSTLDVEDAAFDGNDAATGAAVYALDAETVAVRSTAFTANQAWAAGGGVYARDGDRTVSYTLTDNTFDANTALAGGAVLWDGSHVDGTFGQTPTSLVFTGNAVVGNGAGTGGGVQVLDADVLEVADNAFEGNTGLAGGALTVSRVSDLVIRRNLFCENGGALDGGGVYVEASAANVAGVVENNRFLGNWSLLGGGGLSASDTQLQLRHNTLVGNAAIQGAALSLLGGGGSLAHNVVALHTVQAVSASGDLWSFEANDMWGNTGGDASVPATERPTDLTDDPAFLDLTSPYPCAWNVVPHWGSAVVDAGSGTDLDGSPADLGMTGGAEADPALWVDADDDGWPVMWDCADDDPAITPVSAWYVDADSDGWGGVPSGLVGCEGLDSGQATSAEDCDDDAADVYPKAPEPCDGVDNDCNGVADDGDDPPTAWFPDADADGFGAAGATPILRCEGGTGWSAEATDCDDANATVWPGAADPADDGIDQDCNGDPGRTWITGSAGCACDGSGGPPLPLGWLALAVLAIRRGRS